MSFILGHFLEGNVNNCCNILCRRNVVVEETRWWGSGVRLGLLTTILIVGINGGGILGEELTNSCDVAVTSSYPDVWRRHLVCYGYRFFFVVEIRNRDGRW